MTMTTVPSKKKIESFQDLVVGQKSMDLVTESYVLVHRLPQNEQYGLASQMRRAQPSRFPPILLRVLAAGTPKSLFIFSLPRSALSKSLRPIFSSESALAFSALQN
jgi:hypothetical protein